jgi:hypothetical protein
MLKAIDSPINIKRLAGCHIVHFKAILQNTTKTLRKHMHDSTDYSQNRKNEKKTQVIVIITVRKYEGSITRLPEENT